MATGQNIVDLALKQLGDPYIFGDEGPDSFDCSGLVQWVYKQFGITTPRTTSQMVASNSPLQPIGRTDLKPGDLIFFGFKYPSSHVGIYMGGNKMVEAPGTGKSVRVSEPNWTRATAFRRVPGLDDNPATPLNPPTIGPGTGDGGAGALVGGITQYFTRPSNVTEALTNLGNAMIGIASSAARVGELANIATRALLPSNLLRGAFFFFGIIFVLIGIWFLGREVRDSTP
jgi:hypothetical protein